MDLTRRSVLHLSAAGAACLAVGVSPSLASAGESVADAAMEYFGGLGLRERTPLPMLTGVDAFNGGLRYDETRSENTAGNWIDIQRAARIDDIAKRNRAGVLAAFTIFAVTLPRDVAGSDLLTKLVDFFVDERGLSPERMLFVGTEVARPILAALGSPGQVIERPFTEAYAAGDGSGFFAPSGHPDAPAAHSIAIYYAQPGAPAVTTISYPPEGYFELGEVLIPGPDDAAGSHEHGGFGIERLAMAEGLPAPDFEETRLNLLRIIEEEAERTGKPLPPGYTQFAAL